VKGIDENEGLQSGLGFKISREARDNRFNAYRGSYLFFEYMNYGKWIGSKFNYQSLEFDYRKYVTPLKWLTIAGQIYAEAKFGDNIPIQSLSLMGGDNRMRGIYIGRFRDKSMIEGQVEARFPIYWIFGGTVFTGLGETAPDISGYSLQGIKWTYGFGLRLSVNKATRSNIRFDIGFFEHKPLFFFTFAEAF
jgi:outer membrane protein assembly factor BamA